MAPEFITCSRAFAFTQAPARRGSNASHEHPPAHSPVNRDRARRGSGARRRRPVGDRSDRTRRGAAVGAASPGAARWARAANRYLPRGSIIGFEIGNEPDIYDRWQWLAQLGRGREAAALPRRLSAGTYLNDFRSYARALAHVAPHVPLVA